MVLPKNVRGEVMRQLMGCVRGASDVNTQRRAATAVSSLCLADSLAQDSVNNEPKGPVAIKRGRPNSKEHPTKCTVARDGSNSDDTPSLSDRVMKNLLLYLRKRRKKSAPSTEDRFALALIMG